MSRNKKFLLAGCGGLLACIIILFVLVFWLLGDVADAESYEMSGDIIPSVTKVIGHRAVNSYSTEFSDGVSKKSITCTSSDSSEDVKNYMMFLAKSEGFKFVDDYKFGEPSGKVRLAKESRDKDMILVISIDHSPGEFTVSIVKAEGTLTLKSEKTEGPSDET